LGLRREGIKCEREAKLLQSMELKLILNRLKEYEKCTLVYYEGGERLTKTYGDIYMDVRKFLSHMIESGLQPGDRIGLLAQNCYEWIVIDIACLIGGYITVPFHSTTYEAELENVVERYDLKVIFADKEGMKKLAVQIPVIDMFTLKETIQKQTNIIEYCASLEAEDKFSIVFTSGTTSIPKAIELKVKTYDDFLINVHRMFQFSREDKIILFLPLSHFGQRSYVYSAILSGFNMILCQPQNVIKSLRVDKPTILVAVPYFFENIYKSFYENICSSKFKLLCYRGLVSFSNLFPERIKGKMKRSIFKEFYTFLGGKMRLMVTGSAPISLNTLKFYQDMGMTLYEGYGTNETGLISLNCLEYARLGSVGKIFPNKQVMLDEDGQIRVKSEFCWAERYLEASDKENTDVFASDGYINTGDIGYFDKDGFLYIKGRMKENIVLSNGKKVFPNLIEDELNKSQFIKQSAVFGNKQPYLVAVIVRSSRDVQEKVILKEIKRVNSTLPEYAKVREYIVTDEPFQVDNDMLTSSLKLHRSKIYSCYEKQLLNLY